jgi:hypothetical protein
MISISFTDSCDELLADDWQTLAAAFTRGSTTDARMEDVSLTYLEHSVGELYHIVEHMFADEALMERAASEVTDAAEELLETNRDGIFICAQWQGSVFPCIPLDRDDARPLREALPARPKDALRVGLAALDLIVAVSPSEIHSAIRAAHWTASDSKKAVPSSPKRATKQAVSKSGRAMSRRKASDSEL